WRRYFNGAELPITFYYTNEEGRAGLAKPGSLPRCLIGALSPVREGNSLCLGAESIACLGGKKYLGFSETLRPDFEYFLSCGIPGRVKGERHRKSPELVREVLRHWPAFRAPARLAVFKRWDLLEAPDDPEVVIFFAKPDVLSGLFTLANFDEPEPNEVFTPSGAGCSSVVAYPYLERSSRRPRCVLGMFDITARPYVPGDVLTFSVPMEKFVRMVENMDESFLTTDTWGAVQKRIHS
ncbi:MAG: hypothetical protein FJZ49_08470, partial [Candidatus Verstraetearchaeota archaeon]|nr:hypothetical protein [Candidatus Verstraetearchaeota archaeon]